MKKINIVLILSMLLVFTACEDYVTELEPYNDRIVDAELEKVENLEIQITGLDGNMAVAAPQVSCLADGLADQLWFEMGKTAGSTFQSFHEIEVGEIPSDNSNTSGTYSAIQEVRFYGELIVDRILNKMDFSSGQYDDLKQEGLFKGYFYTAIAKYYLGIFYGNDQMVSGATINNSAFIPQADIFTQAVADANNALENANASQKKMVHTFLARLYLYSGDYSNAATHAAQGLAEGDAPLQMKYNLEYENYYRTQAGETRDQWAVSQRMVQYVMDDAEESKRIKLQQKSHNDNVYFIQAKHVKLNGNMTPFDLLSWQENNLILAELAVRGNHSGDASSLANAVRASHGMTSTVTISGLDDVMTEREKELFCQGHRLIDQKRTGTFHLAADKWNLFPISENEKVTNPNYP